MKKISSEKLAQYISFAIIIVILVFILVNYFGPLGYTNLYINLGKTALPSYVTEIIGLASPEKNLKTNDSYRRVLVSPVALKTKLFKTYNKLEISAQFSNLRNNAVLVSGVLKSPFKNDNGKILKTKILGSSLLDNIDWYKIIDQKNKLILLQKGDDICYKKIADLENQGQIDEGAEYANCALELDPKEEYLKPENKNKMRKWVNYNYNNIDDFLNGFSDTVKNNKVCYLNVENLGDKNLLDDYTPSDKMQTFDKPIRGFQVLETYLDSEELNFNFDYYDLNQESKKSDFAIFVYKDDEKIAEKKITDDGNSSGDQKESEIKTIELRANDLPKGKYKIYLDANDDIIVKAISTTQKYWAFLDKINFYDADSGFEIFSNANLLQFEANSNNALQKVAIFKEKIYGKNDDTMNSQKELNIVKTDKIYSYAQVKSISKINFEKGGLKIKFNNGLLASSLESIENLSNYNLINLINFAKIENEDCDYIISDYFTNFSEKNGSAKSSAVFDVSDFKKDNKGNIEILFNFPGYKRANSDDIKMKSINLKYMR